MGYLNEPAAPVPPSSSLLVDPSSRRTDHHVDHTLIPAPHTPAVIMAQQDRSLAWQNELLLEAEKKRSGALEAAPFPGVSSSSSASAREEEAPRQRARS